MKAWMPALVILFLYIFVALRCEQVSHEHNEEVTEIKKVITKRLLRHHGVTDGVVKIKWDNSEWFERNGQQIRFK